MKEKDILDCYYRQKDRVYRLACFTCKNVTLAEDVFQDVFCKYMMKHPHFQSEDHEKAWFIRTTVNACKDVLKSKWQRDRQELENWDGAEEMQEEPEEYDALREAIGRLPDKYRTVIYLFYYEEYSVKEIGQILHKLESTVRTQLQRGREQLKEMLEKGGISHDNGRKRISENHQ